MADLSVLTAAFKLEPEVDRLLAAPGARRLVLDLAGVTFVDSVGLGALLASASAPRTSGSDSPW